MSNLLTSYPIFESNQVLTSSQLNDLVAYLDEQNRLTRAKLIGTGIVCGFDLKFNNAVTPYELTIFQGMGITSEGYLITEGDCVVRRYRKYTLPPGARYIPFEDPDTTVQDVDLWELLTDDAPTLPSDVIEYLNVPGNFVNDKVVLLFLECLEVDLQSCLGKACDENGKSFEMHLRKLLIGKKDMEKIIARSCNPNASMFPQKYELPEIFMHRLLFSNDSRTPNTTDYFSFSQTYINAIRAAKRPLTTPPIPVYKELFDALRQTYIDFSPILSDQYGSNPFAGLPTASWTQYVSGISAGPRYLGMQYFYDFMKDLILAYNEFRDVAFDLMSECCTDMDCFPRHLMLGEVIPTGSDLPSRYRNYFTYSPLFNNQKEKLDRAISLFQRMVLMTRTMDIATFNNPPKTITPPNTLPVPVLITPSNEKRDPLSMRSIPYYYKIHQVEGALGTLERSWNYEYKRKGLFNKGLVPLAYGNQNVVQTNDLGPIRTPLYYDTDPYNFFRIEGHMRSKVVPVQAAIEQLKKDFNLPFNVVALRLNGDSYDEIAKRCNFDDIRTEYGTLRVELLGMLNRMFNFFGQESAHEISVKPPPQFITSLSRDIRLDNKFPGSVHQPQTGIYTRAFTGTFGITAAAAPSVIPIYAPQRSLAEVNTKMNTDKLNLLQLIRTLNDDLTFDMLQFKFGYNGKVASSAPGFIQHYNAAVQAAIDIKVGINQIIDILLRSTRIKNAPEVYIEVLAYFNEALHVLENFIGDQKYSALTYLTYTFAYRVNQLKANDMTLFSNFIKKHPGIEHQAGVPRGGTFILVYPGNAVSVDPIKRNYAVNESRAIKGLVTEVARLKAQPVMSRKDIELVAQHEAAILNFNTISVEIAQPSIPIQRVAIEGDQVIADFTLPYLCCCDCECDEIEPAKEYDELGIPAIATPYYATYSPGDYAFAKDINLGTLNVAAKEIFINIVPMLQYDKTIYDDSQIRLYVVNNAGFKIKGMSTGNYPNEPATGSTRGSVSVYDTGEGRAQLFRYMLSNLDGVGVDSFYYMFEIVSESGTEIVERSTMAKITIDYMSK